MPGATLCFVKKGNKILMINRNKPPFMGMWNAVGGHIEKGETPEQCAVREIYEESGIKVSSAKVISVFTWNYDDEIGYATLSELQDDIDSSFSFPLSTAEGIVDFKDIDWVLNEKNYGVIEDLRVFLSDIKNGVRQNYHLIYENSELKEVIKK
ncbi:MAG: 8-oxo-dGTP diphosphatase [Candidatus Borkfalkiaceae bacterium]|nr:8-oxo-dGTP diphosphatase [Christensenellaceae bacterium]